MSEPVSASAVAAVLAALAKPEFMWRTIGGVAKDTGLSRDAVLQVIAMEADKIIKSSVPSNEGQELYTTREHFREKASVGDRLLSAIKNRAV
jgi:hypothetical protein